MVTQSSIRVTKPAPVETPKNPSPWRSISGSMAIWLIVWLVGIDFGLAQIKPLRYVDIPSLIFEDQDPLDDKVQAMLSPYNHFNVLMLGSSLLAATAGADFADDPKATGGAVWNFYTPARCFDKMLNQQFNVSAQSINMGIAACMIQEDELLLRRAIEAGKKPKVLVLLLAPRDFLDNSHNPKGHVYKYFANRKPFWQQIDWSKTPQQNFEQLSTSLSTVYSRRGQYLQVAQLAVCSFLHRAPNLYYAQKHDYWETFTAPKLKVTGGKKNSAADKAAAVEKMKLYYQTAYIPLNYGRMAVEMTSLEQTLRLASQEGILTVIVNMPRGAENEQLLPADFRSEYMQKMDKLCAANKITYLNFENDPAFTGDDFTDGVHMSAPGSKKFFQLLCERLAKIPGFPEQLKHQFR